MENKFNLYDSVKIKGTEITGTIVDIDSKCGYFIEKDDKYKSNDLKDLIWVKASDIESHNL